MKEFLTKKNVKKSYLVRSGPLPKWRLLPRSGPPPKVTVTSKMRHIHAFTIHVIVMILLKGVLFAHSSRLIPNKAKLGFCFPCDGLGRGGTCQVSTWDHMLLGLFWMYNSISVVIFHFIWKMQSSVWGSISNQGVVIHIT